jgi:O-acetyl-ADP-ribose deacetylase (regulator of RNase III)
MIKIVNADILTATEACICHQVNCAGVMGAGVAKAISGKYPVVKTEYMEFCNSNNDLLGKVNEARVNERQVVLNIFGQRSCGSNRNRVYTEYNALKHAFGAIKKQYGDKSLAFPYKFGCGLANGNWCTVYGLIEEYFGDMDVAIYHKQ